ncbi:MAG TPA: four helix bundle protein [Gemmatimonadaceae bacterium]|nr:four helix bundle protein [Gemmatimonadaceae bacterium]
MALKLAVDCNRLADGFPVAQRFGLGARIRRSACSVPANIAEGCGRLHRREYVHHLAVARGSLKELEAHLLVAHRLEYLSGERARSLDERCSLVGRMLARLIVSLYDGREPDG